MKKAIKLLFSVACFSMLSLSACGGSPEHTHKYSEDWESDETYHWHVCESCGEKIGKVEHVYDNAHDTDCNICGRSGRTPIHTWSTEWSKDTETHWHACTGCDEKQDEAAHVYDNDHDDKCNECGYDRDIGDHAPKSTWSCDGTHHWHKCTHEGCKLKFDYEEHQLNVVGGCIDCYYSFETIYTVDHSTQSCDITFNNLEAKTYYFWVSELSVDLTYQIRFPYDQVVNCYYYASASATVLSSKVYDFKYNNEGFLPLPSAHYTDFFFNFTVGQDKVGKNYTGINVRSFDV